MTESPRATKEFVQKLWRIHPRRIVRIETREKEPDYLFLIMRRDNHNNWDYLTNPTEAEVLDYLNKPL